MTTPATPQSVESDHPSVHCYTCSDYLDHRQDSLPLLIAEKAQREGRPGLEVFADFMHAAHRRHLAGEALRRGGPTRVTDPYLGRLAALMAMGARPGVESDHG